ncbi:MAG TPA: hypothetical protein VGH28_00740 [Polyangiaceae bacterium]
MRKILVGVALAASICCHAQYRPLDVADSCACRPSEYCKVTPGRAECLALPASCGERPTCACVGDRSDACRDDDGRITLLPPRAVPACDACAPEEFCIDVGAPACRVVPPDCEGTPTCDCVLRSPLAATKYSCEAHSGRVVLRKRRAELF